MAQDAQDERQDKATLRQDAEKMMMWFGATDDSGVTFAMLKERLQDATPMDDVNFMIGVLMDEADSDGDGKLSLRDFSLLLENPKRLSFTRYCSMKLR